ncbi:hypothetical protein [Pseudonocardia spinosispora]|uniref:hypothetical protein n=1 Tax=Pseudonocardia spinosispora TaxID=103441 RepID=UPI000412EE5B|nr:hypothetical protein [Pseudonocardia spinosispora]
MIVLAHGIGGRADLPLPGELVLQAGGFVVLVSFLAVGLAWRKARFPTPPRLPWASGPRAVWVLRWLMVALLGYLLGQAFLGDQDPNHNPAPRALYVLLWVGIVPASLLFGPVWRALNPLRALHRAVAAALRLPVDGARELPGRTGYWPAAFGLTVFVWLELVPDARAEPFVVGTFIAAYVVLTTAAATVYGQRWFDRGDPFEAYSTLVASLSPVGRGPGRRNPFVGLNTVTPGPGLVALLAVWWGSTVFDGVSGTPWWATTGPKLARASGIPAELISTVVLLALIALVAVSYRLATGVLATYLVSTLIPIAVGYTIAHYASLLLVEGPRGAAQLVDPSAGPSTLLPAPLLIAAIQVAAILVGHVVGVIAAHDRVLAHDGPQVTESRRLADEIPLVLIMIVYTMVGLYLLVIA